jgi:fumarate reductase subunit D
MERRRALEPIRWLLFSAGGVLAALFIPVLLFLFGIAFPLGWIAPPDPAHLRALLGHPITKVTLFLLCALSLLHWAHRFRDTLYDGLQMKQIDELILVFCYGGALAGTVAAGLLIW